ncbi:MerR family transcriptional regulator [Rhodococcus sp. OK302]|uniref:MerR family transcriptional regulator n=1 Tax=Rhodococcus sp. OK302 TaxID=1882769 RepID=UPI000B93B051|nr:MerR family transcriptional regulator [Rhodococcus sp. OK302]OYD60835.1 DNA-binding transcriptional MerR regulator [Rhodococcus sp. OK302]
MMRIGEFALASGLTVKALRHYGDIDLLKPADVTTNGYRIYSPTQLRQAATIRALRNVGLSLDTVAEVLNNPDRIDSVVGRHRALVAHERARQDADAAQGSSLIDSLGLDYTVRRRAMPAQPWVGVLVQIHNRELEEVDSPLATLQTALVEAGHTIAGPWWTTLRQTADAEVVDVVFCWPTTHLPVEPIRIAGAVVESGTLPACGELFVTLETSDDDSDLDDLGGEAAHIAIVERAHREGLNLVHGNVRQIGVLTEDGTPEAIELVIALE